MTRLPVTAIAALLVLTSGAWAQSSMSNSPSPASGKSAASDMNTPASAGTNRASSAPSTTASARMKDPLESEDISQIDGTAVAGGDGSKIGKVSTVLMNPSTKRVDRLVVAEGGVLGVGSHLVALPIDAFKWDSQNQNFVVQKTADDLKAMPEWQQPQLAENPNADATPSISPAAGAASSGLPAAPIPPAPSASGTPAH